MREGNSSERRHIPIGTLWSMRIDVPYSVVLREGDLAWSCGQVPLDAQGHVFEPNDPAAQARCVADYIDRIVAGVGFDRRSVGKLVVYHLGGTETLQAVETEFRQTFGDIPLICPVGVPHFYYEGLTLEVDAFAYGPGAQGHHRSSVDGVEIREVACGDLVHVWIRSRGDGADAADAVAALLEARGLRPEALLSDHWFISPEASSAPLARFAERGLASDLGATVRTIGEVSRCTMAELTFARSPVRFAALRSDGLYLCSRQSGPFIWLSGRVEESDGLVAQTKRIMVGLEAALRGQGCGFSDVVKSTTHYVAGRSEAELHENMQVRNAYYVKPGPASTGIPVAGLWEPSSLIAIDILAVRRPPSG